MISIKSRQHKLQIFNKINQTTSSLIYKAKDQDTDKDLVIKIERVQGSRDLLNEVKIAKFLEDCPGIIKIIDYGFYENKRFLVYPFHSHSLLKKKFSREELHKCAKQLINTMEYIHSKGIVHCDISARNVLYSSLNKKYYLNDFGQSRHYDYTLEDAKTTELVGSPTYCSHYIHKYYEYMPRDVFIHHTSLKVDKEQYRYLVQGEYVDLDISAMKDESSSHKWQSSNVTGVQGGMLMCETRQEMRDSDRSHTKGGTSKSGRNSGADAVQE